METLIIMILAVCFANVYSKVHVEGVQAETIRLRLRGIQSEKGNEYGLEGESTWYCQRMKEDGTSESTNPVYFVQPQGKKHKHNVAIEGQPTKSDTTIYVLPPKNSHEIEIQTAENGAAVSKPTFFFLKNHPFEYGAGHHNRESVSSSVSVVTPSSSLPPKDYTAFQRNSKRNRTSSSNRRSHFKTAL